MIDWTRPIRWKDSHIPLTVNCIGRFYVLCLSDTVNETEYIFMKDNGNIINYDYCPIENVPEEIRPRAGDVWSCREESDYCFIYFDDEGKERDLVWRDGTQGVILHSMIHNQNGWKLLFRDGKPYGEGKP